MPTSGHPDIESGHQPRIPGVRYKKVTRYRSETTTIDGQPETQQVPYTVLEPVPPRDLDTIILRAVTGTAVAVTGLSIVGTTASVGGLLGHMVHPAIAFAVAGVFDAVWLACLGVEWLERLDPKRACPARIAGWIALAISMITVAAYGASLGEKVAGGAAASVGLLAKGLWWLVLRSYAVPLSDGTAFWLRRRREKIAASAAVSGHLRRMDQSAAYVQAAYGTHLATRAIEVTTGSDTVPDTWSVPHPDTEDSRPQPAPAQNTPPAPTAPAPVSVHQSPTHPDTSAPTPTPAPAPDPRQTPHLHAVGGPSIADTIRAALKDTPDIEDEDLLARVESVHGKTLRETVRRTRKRIERKAS